LFARCRSIKVQAVKLSLIGNVPYSWSSNSYVVHQDESILQTRNLVKVYSAASSQLSVLSQGALTLDFVDIPPGYDYYKVIPATRDALQTVIINCDQAIGYLQAASSQVPEELVSRLEPLHAQVGQLEDFSPSLHK